MFDFKAITPLGKFEPQHDVFAGVELIEVTDRALASYTLRKDAVDSGKKALATFMKADLPAPMTSSLGDVSAFWMSSDSWMVDAPFESYENLAAQLKDKSGAAASVTEQTDAWCTFDLKGDELPKIMERLCSLDLKSWQGGEARRTSIDHLGCFVRCFTPNHIRIMGPRSSAGSLHHALVLAIRARFT